MITAQNNMFRNDQCAFYHHKVIIWINQVAVLILFTIFKQLYLKHLLKEKVNNKRNIKLMTAT